MKKANIVLLPSQSKYFTIVKFHSINIVLSELDYQNFSLIPEKEINKIPKTKEFLHNLNKYNHWLKNTHPQLWFELKSKIKEFKKIMEIINKPLKDKKELSEQDLFRIKITKTPNNKLQIFLKRNSEYEFKICVRIKETKEINWWYHIDGILEDRHEYQKENITNHPVFFIICINDLFQSNATKIASPLWNKFLRSRHSINNY